VAVGPRYFVTGEAALIESSEDEHDGGRSDDRARAADIQNALADDDVAAIVGVRGGAWFTRILPLIDFTVLEHRTRPVVVFGFSELTTLINIVGAASQGRGVYDMGPAFLTYGLKRFASLRDDTGPATEHQPDDSMLHRIRTQFDAFFRDVVAMIEGRGTSRSINARLARGYLPDRRQAVFVGGNLTVLSTLIGSPYKHCVDPTGHWLVLEDFNDKVERIDRFLAHLTLAQYWQSCEGVLLGDFHKGYEDLTPAVLRLLDYHIPPSRPIPILVTKQVGHVWPMSPLPLHVTVMIERCKEESFAVHFPVSTLCTA
jgi:muramoyltetrapeptide carboxypeptidase